MEKAIQYKTLLTEITDFYADSVEWCPLSPYLGYLLAGTYQLDEGKKSNDDTQVRQGNLTLYQLVSNCAPESDFHLRKVDVLNTAGVLDIKWCHQYINGACSFAVAFSNGSVKLFQIKLENTDVKIAEIHNQNLPDTEDKIALSLDWSSCKYQSNSTKLAVSDSCGNVNSYQLSNTELCLLSSWKAHEFESWVVGFDYDDPQILFSGGDDCYLKGWDLRSLASPIFVNKKHSMGVTSVSKCRKQNLLSTGSYDERIFLWDTRQMKTPLSETSVGGGVWRLKWHPSKDDYLLSAAMHNGVHILQTKTNSSECEILATNNEHDSLAYGSDWCYLPNNPERLAPEDVLAQKLEHCNLDSIVASCSFYDKLLTVWELKLH